MAVAHHDPLDVDDRQREPRPLHEPAHLAHVGEGRDAGRDAALHLTFGLQEGGPSSWSVAPPNRHP